MKKAYILIAFTSVLYLTCQRNKYQFSTDGEYTIVNSAIFLTAMSNEKQIFAIAVLLKSGYKKQENIHRSNVC